MKLWFCLFTIFLSSVYASPLDSLTVRFGAGISKPSAIYDYRNKTQGTSVHRNIPTLPALLAQASVLEEFRGCELGVELGVEGEVLSADRIDGSNFSVGHAGISGARRLISFRGSELWFQAGAGVAGPVFRHAESADDDAHLGPRLAASLGFACHPVRVDLGVSRTWLSFDNANSTGSAHSSWRITHLFMTASWDWLSPVRHP